MTTNPQAQAVGEVHADEAIKHGIEALTAAASVFDSIAMHDDQHRHAARLAADGCAASASVLRAALAASTPSPQPAQPAQAEDAERYTLDEIADAAMQAEVPDSKYESMVIALRAARQAQQPGGEG